MIELQYRLTFNTPAFLGNAEQQGQWRTPPIKALLRQWWRVAYAADHRQALSVDLMRETEGRLFGVAAASDGESRRSQVRLRLDRWDKGRLTSWSGLDSRKVEHPEVKNREGRIAPVGAHLYLGFGPLVSSQGQTAIKHSAAIQAREEASLSLAFPSNDEAPRLRRALGLLHQYGTLGGRSRNGWGSFSLIPKTESVPRFDSFLDLTLTRPWRDALTLEWPHAIGTDESGPLIWQTEPLQDWQAAMRRLAEIKIALRTKFSFNSGRNASAPESRHWLSYPVTNHSVRDWGNNARLPNSLRFKVRSDPNGELSGVIFHMPCLPPREFRPDRSAIDTVWQQVHSHLQATDRLQRIPA
jgi:CRISPR-associated protein Cmr1